MLIFAFFFLIELTVSQSVSGSDGGSGPGDDVCSPDRRQIPG